MRIKPHRVAYRPARRISVRYDGKVEWTDGSITHEMLVADYDRRGLPDKADRAVVGGHEIAVWHAPSDPELPGLRYAMDATFARRMLIDVGINAGVVRLEAAAYRPGSRAVIHAEADLDVRRRSASAPTARSRDGPRPSASI